MWIQKTISLKAKPRGFHLVTREILQQVPEVGSIEVGLMQVFIQHTSASLTINDNADPTVRDDFESFFNRLAPENEPYYLHMDEGSDDMPAHLKSEYARLQFNDSHSSGTFEHGYLARHLFVRTP